MDREIVMDEQIITTAAGERLVVIPEAKFNAMREALDDMADLAAIESFRRRLTAGEEELVPAAVADRIIDGENKVRVWREYRCLTAKDLADKAGISTAYLSQIETGSRDGSFDTIKRIAAALAVSLDDLA
jgi:DNA-binding XRE family transcriptional regulator